MFYRFRYGSHIEFVCIDTSKENVFASRLFEHPKHRDFLDASFPAVTGSPTWRIPFCHHPPYSAGPRHHNTESMHTLLPLFQRAGVRTLFSGHEHNFQHSIANGINYFVSGAEKFRKGNTRPVREGPDAILERQVPLSARRGAGDRDEGAGDRGARSGGYALRYPPIGPSGHSRHGTDGHPFVGCL
jgi:hypothetical protein